MLREMMNNATRARRNRRDLDANMIVAESRFVIMIGTQVEVMRRGERGEYTDIQTGKPYANRIALEGVILGHGDREPMQCFARS